MLRFLMSVRCSTNTSRKLGKPGTDVLFRYTDWTESRLAPVGGVSLSTDQTAQLTLGQPRGKRLKRDISVIEDVSNIERHSTACKPQYGV